MVGSAVLPVFHFCTFVTLFHNVFQMNQMKRKDVTSTSEVRLDKDHIFMSYRLRMKKRKKKKARFGNFFLKMRMNYIWSNRGRLVCISWKQVVVAKFPASQNFKTTFKQGKSLPETLILASTNPKYNKRCSSNYQFSTRKLQAQNMNVCTQIVFCFDIQNNLCTQHVLSM